MNSTSYIYRSRQESNQARIESRPDAEMGDLARLQFGIIKAVQAPGVYQVATLAEDGSEGAVIDGVRPFPMTELFVDDAVWLVQWPGNPMPVILVTGGGGCQAALTDLGGVLFDND